VPAVSAAPLRVLHAIHDFLPRHRAGSEIYAFELCRELDRRHHVTVLAAEFDPARPHGHVTWRLEGGLPVVELVNNWICGSFEETYRSPVITARLEQVLDAVQPDVLHLHSLMNLSFDLPAIAHARRIPVVATLHDYTLVCPSGGQRVHRADDHLCETIDPARCARCFRESPLHAQIGVGRMVSVAGLGAAAKHAAAFAKRRAPKVASALASVASGAGVAVREADIVARLDRARAVFKDVDLFVAPSRSLGEEFARLGVDAAKLRIVDHGFVPLARDANARSSFDRLRTSGGKLRIGYVGTLVWHKGVHVLIDALRGLPADGYELQIFGDPCVFPDYTGDLRHRARGLPVRFMGEFDRARMAEAYAGLDVLVISSLWPENSPLVVREAFMAGVPVVGARIGGIVELVRDGVDGLLYEARSTADLTRALRRLVDDRALLESLARNVPAVKSMDAHARELEAIYAEVRARTRVETPLVVSSSNHERGGSSFDKLRTSVTPDPSDP
jgi:glycosyltransferase involved in cell wall biosynthesis